MTYEQSLPYVGFIVDDSGNGRMATIENDRHASMERRYRPILIGWRCGFEPCFVAVYSYLDVRLDDDEAVEIAVDYLIERKWFNGDVGTMNAREPEYLIR